MTSTRKRKRRMIALTAFAIVYVFALVFTGCSDIILQPPGGHIDASPATRRVVRANGRDVEVWVARPQLRRGEEPEGFVLEFTGNATRAEQIAQFVADRWQKHRIEAWTVNYPGYGGSAGPLHMSLIPPAALACYDELHRVAGDRPIFLEANSLGTTAALYVASQRPVAGLVLQNPPPLKRMILQHYGWWNLWLLATPVALHVPRELNSMDNAPRVTAPAVFILSDSDTVVPAYYHDLVVNAYGGPKTIIHMSNGHNDSVASDADAALHREIDRMWSSAVSP